MILNREQILARRLKIELVDLGDGNQIRVRACPLHVMARASTIEASEYGGDVYVFINVVVDEVGNRLYKDEDAAEVARTVEGATINIVTSKAYALARIDETAQELIKKNWKHLGVDLSGASASPSDTPTPTSSSTT